MSFFSNVVGAIASAVSGAVADVANSKSINSGLR